MSAGLHPHDVDPRLTNSINASNVNHTWLSSSSPSMPLRDRPTQPRFILGIFTVQSEYTLREAVRQNFRFYQDPRVCFHSSLADAAAAPLPPNCQLMYTFVMGITPDAENDTDAMMKTQVFDSNSPVVAAAPPKGFNVSLEPVYDLTFLNIKENMNHGKTSTWFRYAAQVMSSRNHGIDYAIKCDSDTGLRLDLFWPWVRQHLPPGGQAMYAGLLKWSHHTKTPYMLGQFYILSRDLAHAVSLLPLEPSGGDPAIMHLEDADMGYLLSKLSMPMIQMVGFPHDSEEMILPWKHLLKTPERHQHFRGTETIRWCGGLRQARERKGNCTKPGLS